MRKHPNAVWNFHNSLSFTGNIFIPWNAPILLLWIWLKYSPHNVKVSWPLALTNNYFIINIFCVLYRGKGKKKQVTVPVYDSDDERAYSKEAMPDPDDDDFYHDEVDQYHAQKDKVSRMVLRNLKWHKGITLSGYVFLSWSHTQSEQYMYHRNAWQALHIYTHTCIYWTL